MLSGPPFGELSKMREAWSKEGDEVADRETDQSLATVRAAPTKPRATYTMHIEQTHASTGKAQRAVAEGIEGRRVHQIVLEWTQHFNFTEGPVLLTISVQPDQTREERMGMAGEG